MSHIDKKIYLTFLFLTTYLYTFSLYDNPSFIIFSAETEYISTRSLYRNINFLRDRIRRIFLQPWSSSLFLRTIIIIQLQFIQFYEHIIDKRPFHFHLMRMLRYEVQMSERQVFRKLHGKVHQLDQNAKVTLL